MRSNSDESVLVQAIDMEEEADRLNELGDDPKKDSDKRLRKSIKAYNKYIECRNFLIGNGMIPPLGLIVSCIYVLENSVTLDSDAVNQTDYLQKMKAELDYIEEGKERYKDSAEYSEHESELMGYKKFCEKRMNCEENTKSTPTNAPTKKRKRETDSEIESTQQSSADKQNTTEKSNTTSKREKKTNGFYN